METRECFKPDLLWNCSYKWVVMTLKVSRWIDGGLEVLSSIVQRDTHPFMQLKIARCALMMLPVSLCLTSSCIGQTDPADGEAQHELGYRYERGDGVPRDTAKAFMWYRKAAEQGYVFAQIRVGFAYSDGCLGVAKDDVEAVKWFRKAAEQGNAGAQVELGKFYYHGDGVPKNYAESTKWYRKAAEKGYWKAQLLLGFAYEDGEGVPKNCAEALKWYRKAAEQGNEDSQYKLASAYYYGRGVQKNYTEAVKWYRKAAEQGHVGSQSFLGYCYAEGSGVPKDYIQGYKWSNIAAGAKNYEFLAKNTRRILEDQMTPVQISEAQKLSAEWKPKKEFNYH